MLQTSKRNIANKINSIRYLFKLLAGDVSLNPGAVQSVDDRKDKMTFWSFNARSIVIKREN
jgi:hypothetical protein